MSEPMIEIENLSVKYDAQAEVTLKDINLVINRGEKILIAGPSGSGKSTFSRVLNGLIPHAFPGQVTGTIKIAGQDVTTSDVFVRSLQIGTVLQDSNAQFVGLTTAEDLAFTLENDAVDHPTMLAQVKKWAEELQLTELLDLAPQVLSGGQKQRVAMGGVLIDDSPILLFDEPLASLDPASGYRMMQLLNRIQTLENLTVIIIEHRLEEILQTGVDKVVILDEGQIVFEGTAREVLLENKLTTYGLSTPAYLQILHAAGVDFSTIANLEEPAKITAPAIRDQVLAYQATLPENSPQSLTKPLLEIKNLAFSYPDHRQLFDKLSLTLNEGQIVALVGKNGSGKSTLSQLLVGFLHESAGEIRWQQEIDLRQLSIKERAEYIGYVAQDPNSMMTQTIIFDEVAIGLKLRGVPEAEIQAQVYRLLKIAGLYEMRNWPIAVLSYGQKKRLSMLAVLVLEPKLLILDEPTAGQDLRHAHEMMDFVQKLNQELGLTVLIITHDMALMLAMTARALVLVDGQLLADVAPADLLVNPALVAQADLRLTSVYTLANALQLDRPEQLARALAQGGHDE